MGGPADRRGGTGQEPTLLARTPDPQVAAPTQLEPGQVLGGRFELVKRLGEGGAGAVYSARDRLLGEPVALKLLHARMSAGGADLIALPLHRAGALHHLARCCTIVEVVFR